MTTRAVPTATNMADIGTKGLTEDRLMKLVALSGMRWVAAMECLLEQPLCAIALFTALWTEVEAAPSPTEEDAENFYEVWVVTLVCIILVWEALKARWFNNVTVRAKDFRDEWTQTETSSSSKVTTRTVATMSPTTYKWWVSKPHFQVVGKSSDGVFAA